MPSDPEMMTAPAINDLGIVITDAVCVRCGYNLRTLSLHSRCPECGTEIRLSLHANYLSSRDPIWLRRIASGATWLERGWRWLYWRIGLLIACGLCSVLLSAVTARSFPGAFRIGFHGLSGILAFGTGCVLLGAWRITTTDPGALDSDGNIHMRGYARSGVSGGLMLAAAGVGAHHFSPIAGGVLLYMGVMLMILGGGAFLSYLAILAQRIPAPELAKATKSARNGLVVALLLCMVLEGVEWLLAILPAFRSIPLPGPIATLLPVIKSALGLSVLAYLVKATRLLKDYKRALLHALDEAEQRWHSTT